MKLGEILKTVKPSYRLEKTKIDDLVGIPIYIDFFDIKKSKFIDNANNDLYIEIHGRFKENTSNEFYTSVGGNKNKVIFKQFLRLKKYILTNNYDISKNPVETSILRKENFDRTTGEKYTYLKLNEDI